jgi:hypothetical protein
MELRFLFQVMLGGRGSRESAVGSREDVRRESSRSKQTTNHTDDTNLSESAVGRDRNGFGEPAVVRRQTRDERRKTKDE